MLLSLLGASMSAAGSLRARQATALKRNARLDAAAEGAVQVAAFHLLDGGNNHWNADGGVHREKLGDLTLVVAAVSEAGKINPNVAQGPLLSTLLQVVGVARDRADALAAAIVAWRFPNAMNTGPLPGQDYRAPGQPFESLSELGLVPGMTPPLLRTLLPHLTLFHDGDPVLARADPVVRRAVQTMAGIDGGDDSGSATPPDATTAADDAVTVFAWARDGRGHQSGRRAVLLLRQAGGEGQDAVPFRIVDWAPLYGLLDGPRVSG